jgi:hypothetical protein
LLRIASFQTNRLFILLERAEKEIRFSIANGMFKPEMDIDRHGPRLMPNNCENLNPPNFSLPSTFKDQVHLFFKVAFYNNTWQNSRDGRTRKGSVIIKQLFYLFRHLTIYFSAR